MARYKGTFTVAANYEPLIAAPFDARSLVETRSDLINPTTWVRSDGGYWTYVGMVVSVSADIESSNNGLYILMDEDYTQLSNWRKCADEADIIKLQEQINNLSVSGGSLDVSVETEKELPEIGDSNTTYYVKENSSIQRWDNETQTYISYGGESGDIPELDINLIFGGDSNGND